MTQNGGKEPTSLGITGLNHVNITVPPSVSVAAKDFYGLQLGLVEIPKPEQSRTRGGAWYQLDDNQIHLSLEDVKETKSKRHICLVVRDIFQAEQRLREAGVEILPDERPVSGWQRFYVRDPGGNLIEIAMKQ